MKVSGVFVATALVAVVAGSGPADLERRQGLQGVSSIDLQDIVGLAGSDEPAVDEDSTVASSRQSDNDDNDGDNENSDSETGQEPKPSPSSSSSSTKPESTSHSSTDESTSKSTSSESKSSESTSKPESSSSPSSSKSSSSSSSKPSPTGTPCTDDKAKQCSPSNKSGYQVCTDGFWSDQTCGGSDVCGKDTNGDIACMSKDQATVSLEACSDKKAMRCDASDQTKYQACDGSHWQTYTCDSANTCNMDGDKVVCGSVATGDDGAVSYTMHEPTPFVPESAAPQVRAALGAVAAALSIAAAMSFAGF
ncbi:hypothetical protein IWW56_001536 [Coemansia sp. RSA 2131]|nr:hypothetical protein IWW56_001536 [Coemansia sp. RSA 2131]